VDGSGHADQGLLRQEEARRRLDRMPSRSLSLIPQGSSSERRQLPWLGYRLLYYGKWHMRFFQPKPMMQLTELQSCKSFWEKHQAYSSLRKPVRANR